MGLVALLSVLPQTVAADTLAETTEVAVNGPEGALLLMDGQAMGKLPLPVNLVVPAGSHRFRLDLGRQKAESDILTLPANRQAELNLTLSGDTLIAVLRITPGLMLLIEPETAPGSLRASITVAVAAAAKQEHSVLLGGEKQGTLLRQQSMLIPCIHNADCHEPLLQDGQVAYVLSLRVENESPGGAGACLLSAALLDVRTRDLSSRIESRSSSCDAAELSRQSGVLAAKLLNETAVRPRGAVTVSSVPDGANVLVDGRILGKTPFQQEIFAGQHLVEVQRSRYVPHKETIQVEPTQTAMVNAALQREPTAQLARPLWRIVTGSILVGGGLLLAGFGTSALLTNGQCQDGSTNYDTCSPYYSTVSVGGGLLGGGGGLAIAGTIMIAVPQPPSR